MPEDWQRLERELRDLEERDPAVKAARERIDEEMSEYKRWVRQMIREVWKSDE